MKARLTAVACAAALPFALTATTAFAVDTLPSSGGLLVLPNVKVQYANAAQRDVAANYAPASGMRAFKDAETGQFRSATPEEMIEMGRAAAPRPSAKAHVKAQPARTLANGARAVTLGTDALSFSVVNRDASGRLDAACVTGDDALEKALAGGLSAKEHNHAH